MLRGNALARVDEKGRLKLPAGFRSYLIPTFGTELFVTSLRGESVRIYPMPVYTKLEERLLGASAVKPAVTKLRSLLNYYGQPASLDGQGRVLIHPLVRAKAGIDGNVAVLGQIDHVEVWNRAAFERRMDMDPLTDDDLKELASLGF
jgi:transcriptional regulator MraZ